METLGRGCKGKGPDSEQRWMVLGENGKHVFETGGDILLEERFS